jgi:hypothetical protein
MVRSQIHNSSIAQYTPLPEDEEDHYIGTHSRGYIFKNIIKLLFSVTYCMYCLKIIICGTNALKT